VRSSTRSTPVGDADPVGVRFSVTYPHNGTLGERDGATERRADDGSECRAEPGVVAGRGVPPRDGW
jgi:hypothetical protein